MESTKPILMAPYRMETAEWKELKVQLQDLIDRVFICLRVSPWSTPVLFVKNVDVCQSLGHRLGIWVVLGVL